MPHYYKLTLEYDGTNYHGWQKQSRHTTIQASIEDALSRLTQETIKVIGAGRTDAGVHALGQVAHFQLSKAVSPSGLLRGVNALLPCDIAVKKVEEVGSTFHARYGARRKTYRYFIHNGPTRSPWKRQASWHVGLPLDILRMRQAAKSLAGRHDFSSLCATDNNARDHIVDLIRIAIFEKGEQIQITLTASHFLRYMVRNIVGLLVEIGRGKRDANTIGAILDGKDRRLAGITAPPHGLFLIKVKY
ncbi:MAG: tRNA pseudouridine(38-40) synthase TruA [Nitrospirae bacterium]|nr:tRNA pseudouridine(38-40) synthase TruA [Candidatus Troglogloeales bacterium]MBI3598767.1 tRNA pseudouridine(38-40) synthase TruA [Candidatus Troglogloeales bacterium]